METITRVTFENEEKALIEYCKNIATTKMAKQDRALAKKREESLALFIENITQKSEYIESIEIRSPYKNHLLSKKEDGGWEIKTAVLRSLIFDEAADLNDGITQVITKGFPLGFEHIEIHDTHGDVHLINLSKFS